MWTHMAAPTSEQGGPTAPPKAQASKMKPRVPSAEVLPSDRFSFQTHFDVIRRFVTMTRNGTQAIDAEAVEGEGVPAQAASLNVRFFKSINVLSMEERGLYLPTPGAIKLHMARSVSDEKARPILQELIKDSWFAKTAQAVLNSQTPLPEDQFLGELAIAAQTEKTRKEPALRVLLEYLDYSRFVLRDAKGVMLAVPVGQVAQVKEANRIGTGSREGVAVTDIAPGPGDFTPGWHVLQTEDFTLRIRSDLDAIEDLLAHVQTLKRKVERTRERLDVKLRTEPPNATSEEKSRLAETPAGDA